MVTVVVSLDEAGIVREMTAEGHALGFAKGENPVCAAVTVLVRTYLRWIEIGGIESVEGEAPKSGVLYASVGKPCREREPLFQGASQFLLTGLSDLHETFPRQCSLRVKRFKE